MQQTDMVCNKAIVINNKKFEVFFPREEIKETILSMAERINKDIQGKDVVFVVVLKGAYLFAADLIREISASVTVAFVKMSSYNGMASTGSVREQMSITDDLEGKHVFVVEDIIETGQTTEKLLQIIQKQQPRKISICTLLHKPSAFYGNYNIDYIGKRISEEFVVGYGLDYDEVGRNLPDIYQLQP